MEAPWAKPHDHGWTLSVRVQPSSGRSAVMGTVGDLLKVRVAAPANEGKANAELVRFLAEALGVRRSAVRLVQGERSRNKVIEVSGDVDPSCLLATG